MSARAKLCACGCAVVVVAALIVTIAGCGSSRHPVPISQVPRLFAADSVWNAQLASRAPVDPHSTAMVSWLDRQVDTEFADGPSPYIETVSDSTPLYVVPSNAPTVHVTLENTQPWARTLAQALRSVPIPSGARAAAGDDGHITIYQPSTNRLWELWQARRTSSGWSAEWGGAMDNVSESPGYFTKDSWPGAEPYWGATATSLPMIAGTIMINELRAGAIHHALAIALPATRADAYAWPAQRTDGTDTDPDSIPEGARLRIKPSVDIAALHLPPAMNAIALAAQRYGMIVRDKTGQAVALFAQAPLPGQANPYATLFRGVPAYDLLKVFPWRDLEVMKMDLHHGTGSPA